MKPEKLNFTHSTPLFNFKLHENELPTAQSDSVTAYKKYGCLRSVVHYMLINNFHYPDRFRDTLQDYFILHWQSQFLKSKIQNGVLTLQSGDYQVIWHRIKPQDLESWMQCRLSFRKAQPEYNLPAYVLIIG